MGRGTVGVSIAELFEVLASKQIEGDTIRSKKRVIYTMYVRLTYSGRSYLSAIPKT